MAITSTIIPAQTKGVSLMGSRWRNSETEVVASNILFVQRKINNDKWTPFSWEDYQKHCTHTPGRAEREVLDALTEGGKPVWNTSCCLNGGYLQKENGIYSVTDKFLDVIQEQMD